MELKQITWLQSATGVTIAVPLDLLPDPAPEPGKTLTPDEIKAAKTKARDEAAIKANLAHLLAEEERKAEERKQFLLSNAQRVIEPLKPVLQEAFDIGFEAEQQTSTMGIKHKKKTQRDFIAKDGDTSKSGDVQDMQNAKLTKGGQVLDKKAADKAAVEVDKAYGVLRGLRNELLAETIVQMVPNKAKDGLEAGPKLKLFTQDEIIEELFDPLVRSKILPDAFIEDAYSQTQAMLDATNKLYKADLTDPTKFTARGVASVSKGLVDMAAGVCTCVLEATGTINANQTTVSAALAGATQLAKLAIDTGDAIDTARRTEKFDRKGLIALLDQLPDIAGQIVGAATNDSKLQKVVASSATAAEQLVSAAISHNYDDSSKAVGQFLGNMVQSIVNGYATQPGLSTADKNRNAVISDTLGKLLSTAMAGGAPVVAKLIVSGQFAKARGQFARICLDAVAQLPTLMTDIQVQRGAAKDNLTGMVQGQTSGLGDDKVTKTDPKTGKDEVVDGKAADFTRDQNLEYVRNSDLQGGQAGTAKGAAKTLQGAIDATVAKAAPKTQKLTPEQEEAKKKLEALKKQFEQAEETDLRDEIEADAAAELKAFKAQMRGEDNPSLKQNTIDKMIADLKRDQAIMATLIAIGTGGAAVAGKFVSYAAIGTEAIQLAANAKLAYEKMRAAYEFNEELKGARETANAYGTSIDNFFKNAKFQLTVASINAAMNGVKLIVAAVAAAVPHAAPAVPAAAALSSGVNAVMGGIKQAQLKKAWQATKKALKNPKNRRLGMKARKMNPTLAKYSIAYGMMEEDPIAVSMGLACGLNEKTLKNPSTNVAKVKQYLEAKFPDDGTVVGFWEEEKGWEGDLPDPKIDTVTLAKLYKVIGTAFPAIGPIPPGSLAGLVSMVGKKLAKDAPAEDWRERSDLLKELDAMFLAAGKEAAKTADSRSIASVFAEFADLAAEQAFEAWTKAMPQGDVTA